MPPKKRKRKCGKSYGSKGISAARRRTLAGDGRKYVSKACETLSPGDRVFLLLRVSTCTQDHDGNLDASEKYLRAEMKKLGVIVVGVGRYVGSGYEPFWIGPYAYQAEKLGAKLVAEDLTRLIRSPRYNNRNQDAQAHDRDLQELQYHSRGVPLATVLDPNASPGECRSHQIKRGQSVKGKGGRPPKETAGYKKKMREKKKPEAVKLYAEGSSVPAICKRLNVARSTVYSWL